MISVLIFFHILFWLIFIFGGIFSYKMCKINLLIILPLIYFIHILPFHIFVKKKIDWINSNYDEIIKEVNLEDVNDTEFDFIKNHDPSFQKQLIGIQDDRKDTITKIYILEENKYYLPMIQRRLQTNFKKSFGNPCSAQGMVILACIINIYALYFHSKNKKFFI